MKHTSEFVFLFDVEFGQLALRDQPFGEAGLNKMAERGVPMRQNLAVKPAVL